VRDRAVVEKHAKLLADELNVKRVRLLDAASEAVDFRLHPYPRQLGQKHGSRFPSVRDALLGLDPEKAGARLLSGEPLKVEVGGESLEILPEEVEVRVEAHAGFEAAADGAFVAALRTEITPELRAEGLAREFVRRVQEQRKSAGLSVADRIRLIVRASPGLEGALRQHRQFVQSELLADEVGIARDGSGLPMESSFEGETVRVWLERAG
jgi:isoleucyl-tRNA synthetase